MADKFPTDEFDAAPVHGGRHRIRRTAKHRILEFLKIASFSAIVALVGYVGLKGIDSLNFFTDNSTVVAQPVVEEQKPLVVVLDATEQLGFAGKWALTLANAGFNVASAANYTPADRAEREKTVVHIRSAADQATAEAIAKRLKLASVLVSTQFADAITVVLGTDLEQN
jgi:hypothetical protein